MQVADVGCDYKLGFNCNNYVLAECIRVFKQSSNCRQLYIRYNAYVGVTIHNMYLW